MAELLAIYNEGAGSADDDVRTAVIETLRGGADVVEAPVGEKDLEEMLDACPGRDVVVLGGDGSLHVVVSTLYRRGELDTRTVGLVPLGTGNDFARGLGIPLDPQVAARVVLAGRPHPLDLLIDDEGGVVVNAVHLGVGAEASEQAKPLKPGLGRLAYAVGGLLAGVRSPGWRLRVTVDGRQMAGEDPVLMLGIGNGVTIGGGTPLTPRARPDDGMVDVVVALTTGPLERLAYALRLRRGRHPEMRGVTTGRGREVTVEGEAVPVNADGELVGRTARRRWTVMPAAWRMFT
ncbi:diacylglycerol/lipid kinase family protein [Streptosporangium lutulentum]|uniref:YegS/Rv2252/BmrU family lipid kinase n=1 Tax=Streptosporangium lutulentum TaxID=1461250 RepID=A0ABT9QAR0_9ACTN|nr:YegS/Rv2252/BmrU family lipid kinase [Streptosporangium lutulentum]MDP9843857.1 YegS/Rv2252/BmrU family lipid kinase [Streptosporangium lutulentum]